MAITSTDKLIDLNRLGAFLTKLRNTFVAKVEGKDLSDNNLTDEMVVQIGKIAELVAEGGEPNTIDIIKVNNTALTPDSSKAVNIKVPTITVNTVKDDPEAQDGVVKDVYINGEGGSLNFYDSIMYDKCVQIHAESTGNDTPLNYHLASVDYVTANGGKIDKIKVNNTEQTITNKEVDLTIPTMNGSSGDFVAWNGKTDPSESTSIQIVMSRDDYVEVQTRMADGNGNATETLTHNLVNKNYVDSTFRTETQVSEAITAALADITSVRFQLVTELPETGENGVFYLVPITGGKSKNLYEEFVWINKGTTEAPEFVFESLGPTSVDLTNYLKYTDITLATTEDIDGLFTPATGA